MKVSKSVVILVALLGVGFWTPSARAFTIDFSSTTEGITNINPSFSSVSAFSFEIEFAGPLIAGVRYDNSSVGDVQYVVEGGLSLSPPTPSGFPGFLLNRTPAGEGAIVPMEWISQGSSIRFEIATSADLFDGLQLDELVPDAMGMIFEINGREFERLDRARYHPPLLQLYADGTGLLQNSNNSSGSTTTVNPATGLLVDVDFGDEYITDLVLTNSAVTIVTPEPGTGVLLAAGLGLLARRSRAQSVRSRQDNS